MAQNLPYVPMTISLKVLETPNPLKDSNGSSSLGEITKYQTNECTIIFLHLGVLPNQKFGINKERIGVKRSG